MCEVLQAKARREESGKYQVNRLNAQSRLTAVEIEIFKKEIKGKIFVF